MPEPVPASPRPLRAAIIGTGMIAAVHRRAIVLNGATVTGVLGSRPERAAAAAGRWSTKPFSILAELLESDVDVVHVCTPNATHREYAVAAIEAGKHVVCEKPLGLDVADAEAMHEAAVASGRVATVPFVYRYHPLVREIRARRLAGEFGRLTLLHGSYLQDWLLSPTVANWRVDAASGGRSRAFGDIGSHWCDLVEWVSGETFAELTATVTTAHPSRPLGSSHAFDRAAGESRLGPVDTEDIATLLLRTVSGVPASAAISQVAPGRKNRLWFELDGLDASATFDQEQPETAWLGRDTGSQILVRDPGTPYPDAARMSDLPAGHAQGYAECFEHFVRDTYAAIRGETPEGLPTFADGLRSAHIVDAVLRSANSGRWEPIAKGTQA